MSVADQVSSNSGGKAMGKWPLLLSHVGLWMLVLLAAQFGAQPFLSKACIPAGVPKSSLVFGSEFVKLTCCLSILLAEGRLRLVLRDWTFRSFIASAGAPSLTYLVQNYCVQVAYEKLDGVVFNVLNQLKMLATAFFVYLIAGKGQSTTQCFALLLVSISGALVSMGDSGSTARRPQDGEMSTGLLAVFMGIALSGLGSGIAEVVLRGQKRDNYLFSVEMASISCVIVLVSSLLGLSPDAERWREAGLFAGWGPLTVIPVATQAFGGILVGQITKVSGSVQKNFAIIVGLIFSCMLRSAITGEWPSLASAIAVPLAGASIYLHSMYPLPREHPLRRFSVKEQ